MICDVLLCIRSDILWDFWFFFRLINSAQKIHKEAELNESLGDDERAYILYMKYFNVVTLARKLPDYKKQKVVDNFGHHLMIFTMIPWKVFTWFSNVNPWLCWLYKYCTGNSWWLECWSLGVHDNWLMIDIGNVTCV